MTPCIRYGAKKIEKIFFVSIDVKMILKWFCMCFDVFYVSKLANQTHELYLTILNK